MNSKTKEMTREECEQLLIDALRYFSPRYRYVTDEDGNIYYRKDVTLKAMELFKQSLPPAEGAEDDHSEDITLMAEFAATLHATKIADKMVENRLREELISYNAYLYEHNYTDSDIWIEEPNPADEYLKVRDSHSKATEAIKEFAEKYKSFVTYDYNSLAASGSITAMYNDEELIADLNALISEHYVEREKYDEAIRRRDELREALIDMVWQFARRNTYEERESLYTGGLSALEDAFKTLGIWDPIAIADFVALIKNTDR